MTDRALIDAMVLMLQKKNDKPIVVRMHPTVHAKAAVYGFLRWGFEPSYTLADWCRDGDFFLIDENGQSIGPTDSGRS